MLDATKRWYALYTKSRAEKKVAKELEEKGIAVYLPLQKTMKQWSDRRKTVYEPLFRSYVFVRVNNEDYIGALTVSGVVCYVTISGEKVHIPDYQIDAVRTFLGELALNEELNYFEDGDEIEVVYGSLKGLRGKLVSSKDQQKLIVQIDALKQNITLIIPSYLIKRIKNPTSR
ncbi:MAG: UpxY family transcription antiterminator [Bacteroidales bacterium]|nr:UpxY family transcription antiterminator [Bacteroidales bacterium]